jgi:membrane protease YdiL (CAAX protease family)
VAQWAPFSAVVAVLTVLLLVLSRQSQAFIHAHAERDEHDDSPNNDPTQDRPPREDATPATQAEANSTNGTGQSPASGTGPERVETGEAPTEAGQERAESGPERVETGEAPTEAGQERAESGPERAETGEAPTEAGQERAESGPERVETGEAPTEAGQERAESGPEPAGATQEPAEVGQELDLTSTMLLANVASTQALFAGVVLAAAWYFSIPAEAFGVTAGSLAGGPLGVGVGFGFGLALWLANELSTTAADAVGAAYDETVRSLLAPDSARGWVGLLVVVLPLIAVAEELLFRAALIGVPAAGFGVSPWLLAVVASLAFALGHGAQGRVGIVVTGVLGLALATGYILTDSLLVVVVAHYVINAMEFLLHEFLDVEPLPSLATPSG